MLSLPRIAPTPTIRRPGWDAETQSSRDGERHVTRRWTGMSREPCRLPPLAIPGTGFRHPSRNDKWICRPPLGNWGSPFFENKGPHRRPHGQSNG